MSIIIYGALEFKDENLQLDKRIEVSFDFVQCAIKNKIGIKVGGNTNQILLKNIKDMKNKLAFELTDDPIDTTAECLFAGNGIKIQISDVRIDSGESLASRMTRLQNFFREMLENIIIKRIDLRVNIEDGDEYETILVNADDFCNTIVALYEQENNWTPTVRIEIV